MRKLNFGCGEDIKTGWENVDIQKDKKLSLSFDFNKFPYPIEKNTYEVIYSKNVLEHLEEPDKVLDELWRICKPKGKVKISVPYYNNKGAYSDMQHKHFFSDTTFICLVNGEKKIKKDRKFRILELKLIPTKIGKVFPEKLRRKIALFIGGIIAQVEVTLEVEKQ